MNVFVDAIMIVLFVAFMIFVFRGYHVQRLEQIEGEAKDSSTGDDNLTSDAQSSQNGRP